MQLINRAVLCTTGKHRVQRGFDRFIAAIALLSAGAASNMASAATITVNLGGSIASGISAAAPGDTVQVNAGTYIGGVTVNKSISLVANGVVTVQSGTLRAGTALTILSNDVSVVGFTFQDFGWSVSTQQNSNRSRVTLQRNVFRRSGTVWVQGDSWLVENCEFDRPFVDGQPAGTEDYMNVWGSNHIIRRCYFHGLQLYGDIPAGAHNDCIQMFNVGNSATERLTNLLVEECVFTDFVQGIHITNDANASPSPISNITVRNNVFWGIDFVTTGWNGGPAHEVLFRNHIPGVRIENNILRNGVNNITLYSMDSLIVQGNITADGDNPYSLLADAGATTPVSAMNRGTLGNLFWGMSAAWALPNPLSPDRTNVNPQFANVNDLDGPDNIIMTADDGWRPTNTAVAAYGPQISGVPPPPPPPPPVNLPPVANAGPDRTVTIASGQTTLTVALLGSGTDADGTVASYRWTGTPDPQDVAQPTVTLAAGSYTFGLVVTDNLGSASAVDTILVTVLPYAAPPPLSTLVWNRIRVYNTAGSLLGYRWVQTTPTDVRP